MRALIIFLAISLGIIWQTHATTKDKVVITGSSTIAPAVSDLAKAFEKSHPDIRIDVQTGGSSRGITDVRKKLSHIGMVSRRLKDNENDLTPFTIAQDGIAIIIHKSNPVNELSKQQVRDIFKGVIKNWKDVGGPNKRIVVVNKAEGRSTLELFLEFFDLKNSEVKADVIIGDNEQGIKTVSKNPVAVGYVSIGTAEYNVNMGTPLRLLKVNGIEATVKNVEAGKYPLTRELNLVVNKGQNSTVDKFISYALSKDASPIIRDHYFVPTKNQK